MHTLLTQRTQSAGLRLLMIMGRSGLWAYNTSRHRKIRRKTMSSHARQDWRALRKIASTSLDFRLARMQVHAEGWIPAWPFPHGTTMRNTSSSRAVRLLSHPIAGHVICKGLDLLDDGMLLRLTRLPGADRTWHGIDSEWTCVADIGSRADQNHIKPGRWCKLRVTTRACI